MRSLVLPPLLVLCLGVACAPARQATLPAQSLTLSGWFHTVWGERAHYWLIDDRQQWTELQLGTDAVLPPGAPQALEGKRVVLAGTTVSAVPRVIRVTSLSLSLERR